MCGLLHGIGGKRRIAGGSKLDFSGGARTAMIAIDQMTSWLSIAR